MKILQSINIKNFKLFLDETIDLNDVISCIGANESGKSNLLNAINHLASENQDVPFEFKDRNICTAQEQSNLIELKFEIYITDQLIPKFCRNSKALIGHKAILIKSGEPNSAPVWDIEIDIPNIGNLVFITGVKAQFKKPLTMFFKEKIIDQWFTDKYFISSKETNLSKNPFYELKKKNIIKVVDSNKKLLKVKHLIKKEILENIQINFWKYEEKNYLKEYIPISTFCDNPKKNDSIYGIFKIAKDEGAFGFDITKQSLEKNIIKVDGSTRNNLLSDISDSFNLIFKKSWKTFFGNRPLKISITYEGDDLCFRIHDGRDIPPHYRSDGLKWFLTFLINFQSKQHDLNSYILLMDEPGGLLHPQGQKDALKFLLKLAENNQIIYSTHQTFLLDKNCPENVRILSRTEKNTRLKFHPTQVNTIKNTHEHLLTDSLLRESLGFILSDISPLNEKNILVEGTFDRKILMHVNKCTNILDLNSWSIINCGGASNIKHLAMLLKGNGLKVICIYDNDQIGAQMFDNNEDIDTKHKLFVSDEKGETLEDILPDGIFNEAFSSLLKLTAFKKHFDKSIPFNKPFMAKTFDKMLKKEYKEKKNKSIKSDLKHQLENKMEILFKENISDFNDTKIAELLKNI